MDLQTPTPEQLAFAESMKKCWQTVVPLKALSDYQEKVQETIPGWEYCPKSLARRAPYSYEEHKRQKSLREDDEIRARLKAYDERKAREKAEKAKHQK